MKNKAFMLAIALMMAMTTGTVIAKGNHNEAMTKQADGTYVVNTTTLAKDVRGFRGNTPLNIYIKGNKVVKIEPLANQETPNFFNKVKTGLLKKWYGMKVSKASTTNVGWRDGCHLLQQGCEGERKERRKVLPGT